MFAVDTNILLYAAVRDFPEHPAAFHLVEQWRRSEETWCCTWKVLYEFLRVSTHAAVLQKPLKLSQAIDFVAALFESPSFAVLMESRDHLETLENLATEYPRVTANLVHDFHLAVVLREHGVRTLYTADTDFLQFRFLDVVDPIHKK